MAPGPHDVVLRDVRARAGLRAGLPALPPRLRLPVQLLLRGRRRRGTRGRGRGLVSRPGAAEIAALPRAVDEAMVELLDTPAAVRGRGAGRARPPPRAAAPGAAAHGHQARAVAQPARPRLHSTRPRRSRGRPAPWSGSPTTAAWSRSATTATASRSTTSTRATPSYLEPFALADRPVTCGEWLAFIDDGGYQRPELWLSDGWAAVSGRGVGGAALLVRDGDGTWTVFTLGGRRPVDPTSRCATSATTRPTPSPAGPGRGCRPRPSGSTPSPAPARSAAPSSTSTACTRSRREARGRPTRSATCGSGPSSAYSPYPGFRPAAGAVGEYNGKFMVNQHVLRGGSCVTPPDHVRADLPQLLPALGALAVHRPPPGPRR